MQLADIRAGLDRRLKQVPSLQVVDGAPSSTAPVPCAWYAPPSTAFDATMGYGSDDHRYEIAVVVSRADDGEAMRRVEEYQSGSGAKSVRLALETPATGDTLADCMVRVDTANSELFSPSDANYMLVRFSVLVTAPGTA